jgi:hypothetical protein
LRKTIERRFAQSPTLLLRDWRKKAIGILSGVVIASGVLAI